MKKAMMVLALAIGAFFIWQQKANTAIENNLKNNKFMNNHLSEQPSNDSTEVRLIIHTTMGDMTVKLYNETPKHRDNFIKLAKSNYYDSLLFHRVIDGFMIQAGDPTSKNATPATRLGGGGPNYTVEAEFNPNCFHKKGALAAARQGDAVNPEKRSSGSQFYIVQGMVFNMKQLESFELRFDAEFTDEQYDVYTSIGGTPQLDGQYTVFGEVLEGLDIIDKIAKVRTDANDRPNEDVLILSIEILE